MSRTLRWLLIIFLAIMVLRDPAAAAHLTLVVGQWLGSAASSVAHYAAAL